MNDMNGSDDLNRHRSFFESGDPDQKQAGDTLKEEHERLLSILEGLEGPVYVCDPQSYEMLFANKVLENTFGPMGHRKCYEYLQERKARCPFCTNDRIFSENLGKTYTWEFRNEKNGRWYHCTDKAILWPDGRHVRCEVAIDITAQKNTEQALRDSETLLAYSQQMAQIGSWKFDLSTQKMTLSDEIYRIYGIDKQSFDPDFNSLVLLIHPDDRAMVHDFFRTTIKDGLETAEIQHRIIRQDTGEVRYVLERCINIPDNSGKTIRTFGMTQDITDQKQADEEIRWRNEDLELMNAINIEANQKEDIQSIVDFIGSHLKRSFDGHILSVFIPDRRRREFRMVGNAIDPVLRKGVEKLIGRSIPVISFKMEGTHPFTEIETSGKEILSNDKNSVVKRLAGFLRGTPWPSLVRNFVTGLLPVLCDLLEYKSSIALPMRSKGNIIGYLELGSKRLLTGHDVVRLQSIADHLATVIARFESEEQLRETEERMTSAFQYASIGMAFVSLTGKMIRVNPVIPEMLGYTEEELLEKNFQEITHPDDLEKDVDFFRQMLKGKIRSYQLEKRYIHKSGKIVWALLSVSLVHDRNGHPIHFISQVQDITQRKRAEEIVAENEKKFRTLYETMAQGVVYQDRTGIIIDANPAAERILGLTLDQMQGRTSVDPRWHTIHEDGSPFPGETHPAMISLSTGKVSRTVMGVFNPSLLQYRWINVTATPEFVTGDDKPIRVFATFEDITDLKNAYNKLGEAKKLLEEKVAERTRDLRESNIFHKAILDNAPIAIFTTDMNGIIRSVNPAGEAITEYSSEEIIGKMNPLHFHDPDEMRRFCTEITGNPDPSIEEQFSNGINNMLGQTTEWTWIRKSGERFPVKISLKPLLNPDGDFTGFLGLITDVTAEKAFLEALRASETENRAIVQAVPDLMFRVHRNGTLLDAHSQDESTLLIPKEQFLGKKIPEIFPADLARQSMQAIEKALDSGTVEQFEYMLPIGGEDKYYEDRIIAISEDQTLSIIRDITARIRAQQQLIEAKNEAEKANLAKSEFLSRMSHELRTPMNSILGFAQLLGMGELNPKQRKGVAHILNNGKHLLDLINEVLDISGIEAGKKALLPEPVALTSLIDEIIDSLQGVASKRSVTISFFDKNTNNHIVVADRIRLKQILINLMGNAIKYNRENGTVTIQTAVQSAGEKEDPRIRISITDTGFGIRQEDAEKLFQPFERIGADKTEIEGTGLGLMLVKKLTEAMGGKVGIFSEVGAGSTFWIELPQYLGSGPVAGSTEAPGSVTIETIKLKSTILYVEDNLPNTELVEHILTNHRPGVHLITTTRGRQAVTLAKEHKPAMILLDLDLPDIQGIEVLSQLQADPATQPVPVIVVSADAMPFQIEKLLKAGAKGYVTKPLDISQFMKIIDQHLLI